LLQELQKEAANFILALLVRFYGQENMPITENAPVQVAMFHMEIQKQIGEEIISDTARLLVLIPYYYVTLILLERILQQQ
jgi:UDP-glucose 4-epimerase